MDFGPKDLKSDHHGAAREKALEGCGDASNLSSRKTSGKTASHAASPKKKMQKGEGTKGAGVREKLSAWLEGSSLCVAPSTATL